MSSGSRKRSETFHGKACRKCGSTERYVKTKACAQCQRCKNKSPSVNKLMAAFLRGSYD